MISLPKTIFLLFQHPIGLQTTVAGKPVEIRETNTINTDLLENQLFIENVKHIVSERIPAREVLSKGTGAYGYLEVLNDVTEFTKAKLFEKVGKKTPLFVRFSTSQVEKGGSDSTTLAVRGFAVKLYTEEGNLDFLNIQIPVYVYRDPIIFSPAVHALRGNPTTNMRDFTQVVDFLIKYPYSLHAVVWLVSEFGLPRGFRRMNGFPIHAYQIYNKHGESFLAKFKFLAEKGYESLTLEEASELNKRDQDFFMRDLYNAIERKKYPSWRLEMDVISLKGLKELDFDPFDVTRLWKNGTYRTVPIGRIVLNRNVDKQFAEVEQSAFNPANLVPGILGPRDQLFRGRVIAYADAHQHRLGINNHKIEINAPRYAKYYHRDGSPPVRSNFRDAPNYIPNSFNGPLPTVDQAMPDFRVVHLLNNAVDFGPVKRFYNEVLKTEEQKNRLTNHLALLSLRVPGEYVEKLVELLRLVDKDLASRYAKAAEIARNTIVLPSTVEDLDRLKKAPTP